MGKKMTLRRGAFIGISIALITALIFPAAAATITKTINAQFGINIAINNLPFTPTDATGNKVEAMVVNGTTYLPVRALGEATGTTVHWDGATNTVNLYTSGNGEWISVDNVFYSMMNAGSKSKISENTFYYTSDIEALKQNSEEAYQTGFIYSGENVNEIWWVTNASVTLAIDKQYSEIEFDLSVIYDEPLDDALRLNIKGDDGIIYKTHQITAGTQKIKADISGTDRIKIEIDDENLLNYKDEVRKITIGDMKLRG